MWYQFFLEIFHFALYLLTSLVFFGCAFLYYDSLKLKKQLKDVLKLIGYLLLSLVFLLHAADIETVLVPDPFLGKDIKLIVDYVKIIAYLFLITGLFIDPLQPVPTRSRKKSSALLFIPLFSSAPAVLFASFADPVLTGIVAFLYLRRATVGLENHLKTVSLSFYLFFFYELTSLSGLFTVTKNVDLYNLVSPFSPLWIANHLILLIASVILLKWVFFYLFKRLETQLFFIFVCSIVSIFLLTAITFTSLLVKNVETDSREKLTTDVRVLDYALNSKLNQILSETQLLAQNPQMEEALEDITRLKLKSLTQNILFSKKLDTLLILNKDGQVLLRAEDPERYGDSLSSDNFFKRLMLEESLVGASQKDAVIAPVIFLKAGYLIKNDTGDVLGAVLAGNTIDNAFVDNLKKATGLEASVFAGNIISATTIIQPGTNSRLTGIKENNRIVRDSVINRGQNASAVVRYLGSDYLSSFLPVNDSDSNPVGMIAVAKPHIWVLQTAGRSLELTFLFTVILIVLTVFPANIIAGLIVRQIT